MKLLLILLISLIPSFVLAQDDELPIPLERGFEEKDRDILRQLASPVSYERVIAILECNKRELFTETLIERMWDDWRYVLVEVLDCIWPNSADILIDRLYEYEDEEYKANWAWSLWKHRKLSRIDEDLTISKIIQDYFYDDYKSRASISRRDHASPSYVFGEKYEYIASIEWLYSKFIADKDTKFSNRTDKELAHWFYGDYDKIEEDSWVHELTKVSNAKELPSISNKWVYDSIVGRTNATVYACVVLNKRFWVRELNEACKEWAIEEKTPDGVRIKHHDFSNSTLELLTMSNSKKAMEAINEYDKNINANRWNAWFMADKKVDDLLLLHHSLCINLRAHKDFELWIKERNHRISKIPEADPSFEHGHFGYD